MPKNERGQKSIWLKITAERYWDDRFDHVGKDSLTVKRIKKLENAF